MPSGHRIMVLPQPSKLMMRVRFPLPAPAFIQQAHSIEWAFVLAFFAPAPRWRPEKEAPTGASHHWQGYSCSSSPQKR